MDYTKIPDDEIYEHFCTISRQRILQLIQRYEKNGDEATAKRLRSARERLKSRKWLSRYGMPEKEVKAARAAWLRSRFNKTPNEMDSVSSFKDFLAKTLNNEKSA